MGWVGHNAVSSLPLVVQAVLGAPRSAGQRADSADIWRVGRAAAALGLHRGPDERLP